MQGILCSMVEQMQAVQQSQGIFYLAAYHPSQWLVLDGHLFYWAEHMLSDQAPIYNANGFLRVTLRSTDEIKINAGDTYLDQVLICCLILCASLCGKPIPTQIGSSPFRVDHIKMEQLYKSVVPTTGDVTMHFKDIEKALCSKIATKKIIE